VSRNLFTCALGHEKDKNFFYTQTAYYHSCVRDSRESDSRLRPSHDGNERSLAAICQSLVGFDFSSLRLHSLSPSELAGADALASIHARRRSLMCRTVLCTVSDEASSDELSKPMMERLGHRALPPRLMHRGRDARRSVGKDSAVASTLPAYRTAQASGCGERAWPARRVTRRACATSTDGGAASWLLALRACMSPSSSHRERRGELAPSTASVRARGGGRRDKRPAPTRRA